MKRLTIPQLYYRAECRIRRNLSRELADFCLADSFCDDSTAGEAHLRWLIKTPLREIKDWAIAGLEASA